MITGSGHSDEVQVVNIDGDDNKSSGILQGEKAG